MCGRLIRIRSDVGGRVGEITARCGERAGHPASTKHREIRAGGDVASGTKVAVQIIWGDD